MAVGAAPTETTSPTNTEALLRGLRAGRLNRLLVVHGDGLRRKACAACFGSNETRGSFAPQASVGERSPARVTTASHSRSPPRSMALETAEDRCYRREAVARLLTHHFRGRPVSSRIAHKQQTPACSIWYHHEGGKNSPDAKEASKRSQLHGERRRTTAIGADRVESATAVAASAICGAIADESEVTNAHKSVQSSAPLLRGA